jgi:hypothetical protein
VGQARTGRRLRLGQRPLRLLARRPFRGGHGVSGLEPVDRGIGRMVAAPVQHGHRDLAVLREAPPLAAGTEPIDWAWRLGRDGPLDLLPARHAVQA